MELIQVIQDDVTRLEVDAVVNAANGQMLGGGGVDGAIHRAAGPELLEACRRFPVQAGEVRCPTGECRVTPGFNLPARFIIHTVGPIWQGGNAREEDLLRDCYRNSLQVAICVGARSIAFPAISCGAYGFPWELAAKLSVDTLRTELDRVKTLDSILLVAFDEQIKIVWEKGFAR